MQCLCSDLCALHFARGSGTQEWTYQLMQQWAEHEVYVVLLFKQGMNVHQKWCPSFSKNNESVHDLQWSDRRLTIHEMAKQVRISYSSLSWAAANIVTRLWAGQLGFNYQQGLGRDFFTFVTASRLALGSTQLFVQWVLWLYPQRYSSKCLKLTTHLHLVSRLRMHGAIPWLPHTSSWGGA